jgi:leucyl-tRNA synthetase
LKYVEGKYDKTKYDKIVKGDKALKKFLFEYFKKLFLTSFEMTLSPIHVDVSMVNSSDELDENKFKAWRRI